MLLVLVFKNDSVKVLSRDALNGELMLLLEFELSLELVVAVGSKLESVLESLFAPVTPTVLDLSS